jgi:hypothetical protein
VTEAGCGAVDVRWWWGRHLRAEQWINVVVVPSVELGLRVVGDGGSEKLWM